MKILCLADIHCRFTEFAPSVLPEADVCVIAGDLTNYGFSSAPQAGEVTRAGLWLKALSERFPVLWIPGNHDIGVNAATFASLPNVHCLLKNAMTVQGLTFYGESLCTAFDMPQLAERFAYTTADAEEDVRAWADVGPYNVIVSHCPPLGILDKAGTLYTPGQGWSGVRNIGSPGLLAYIKRQQPRLVVCGHAHGNVAEVTDGRTRVVNTAQTWTLVELETPPVSYAAAFEELRAITPGVYDGIDPIEYIACLRGNCGNPDCETGSCQKGYDNLDEEGLKHE